MASVSPARWAAFRVLERVGNTSAHSDDLLYGPLMNGLSTADTSLANALVMGVLRWQLALEAELLPLLSRPDVELPSVVATALRLGTFQLRHMDRIPAHAALSESVELVKLAGQPQAAGMVNAVLRKVAAKQTSPTATPGQPAVEKKPIFEKPEAMAARLGHPQWLVERWIAAYGRKPAEAVCEYDLHEPADGTLFAENDVRIDDGSRLIAEIAAVAAPEAKRVWDTCAAPGGKTLVLANRLTNAELLATDVSPKRLARMDERLQRETPGRVRTLLADASQLSQDEGTFDLILCDAPCSGTGTLARNPEIKVRLDEHDLPRQAERQRAILAGALSRLAKGGRLVYSTCSLEPEENERIVESVMRDSPDTRITNIESLLDSLVASGRLRSSSKAWVRDDFLRTLPGANFAGDGFFAAVLERP